MKGVTFNYLPIILVLGLLWPVPVAVAQQGDRVQGRVQDAAGRPVADALVTASDRPEVQARTDEQGWFDLGARVGERLEVTADAYRAETVRVDGNEITVTLEEGIDDVPLGYGLELGPAALTSAVGIAGAPDIEDAAVIHPGNALYGEIAGLTVLQNGGTPPSGPSLLVRGRGTLGDSSPLVLVDGFERPLSSMWVGAIETVTVLKDAAALAKYGQRGANGVVLVTTKRGAEGGLQVRASSNVGVTQPTALPELVGAVRYAQALNEARLNDGQDPRFVDADLQAFAAGDSPFLFPNVDWMDEVLRDRGLRTDVDVNFRGGGSRTRYFATLNYTGDSGLFSPISQSRGYDPQLSYRRLNLMSNLDIDITEGLLFQVDVYGSLVENNQPASLTGGNDLFNSLYTLPSAAYPVRTPSGRWGGDQLYGSNPVAVLATSGYGNPNSREFSLTGRLEQDLGSWMEGLSAEVAASYYNYGQFLEAYTRSFGFEALAPVRDDQGQIVDTTVTPLGQDTDLEFSDSFGASRQFTDLVGKLNYARPWGDGNTLAATVLAHQSANAYNGQDNTYHRRNFAADVHAGWAGKYFLGVSASASGSNVLPEGDRYGFFPAVSAAWLLSEEGLLSGAGFVDLLKLRASWGMTGSDLLPVGNPYQQRYHYASGYFWEESNASQGGFAEGQLASTNFTYETSSKTNLGVDATLFEHLGLSADVFYDRRTNILTSTAGSLSDVIGNTAPLAAEGIVDNRGVEAAVNWRSTVGALAYHIGGQVSYVQSEIVEMNEEFRPHAYLQRTGRPVGQWFGLEAVGFFEDEEDIAGSPVQVFSAVQPGDVKYRDQNGDGIINEFDQVALGYAGGYPELYFSTSLGMNYKGFAVSALFQGTGNHTALLNTPGVFRPLQNDNTISTYYYDRRWTPETADTATLPRLSTQSNSNNLQPSSIWLVDGSYIKLRQLEVSYTLPASLTGGVNLHSIQILARGMNLFSIDDIPVLDPEHLGTEYPILRSYSVGLAIQF